MAEKKGRNANKENQEQQAEQNDEKKESAILDITTQEEYDELKRSYVKIEEKCNQALALAREYKADMERMKERNKNIEKEKTKEIEEKTLLEFIPVLDNLEIAVKNCDDEKIKKGIQLIQIDFAQVIKRMGAEEIDTKQNFNPQLHEAISTIPAPDEASQDKIAHVLKKGYKLYDKTIRPAQVVVYGRNKP